MNRQGSSCLSPVGTSAQAYIPTVLIRPARFQVSSRSADQSGPITESIFNEIRPSAVYADLRFYLSPGRSDWLAVD